ncbi:MAG: flagellar biosynthesis protein FlhF [Phycisphaerae bacterium]|nr:flagellar biosynthesis protein FlhF [Phycisphaerae bacterium]
MKNLKTFQAKTMAEAIDQVKRRLGRDAVIMHTRTVTRGGVLGFGGQPLVEVTAAAGDMTSVPARQNSGVTDQRKLLAEFGELRAAVQGLVQDARLRRVPNLPEELLEAYTSLIQTDVAEDIAVQLVDRIRGDLDPSRLADPQVVRRHLAAYVESMLPVAGPILLTHRAAPAVIALIGPTGVGKTTTIAKLAANFSLREGKKVGIITIDTYRIAAVEQMRTYARIINVPLEVVMSPSQLRGTIDTMKDRDVILLDTAGRSHSDQIKLNELKCYLDEAKPHEVHLVLSATTSRGVLSEAVERFGVVGVDRVIFTKLDEAVGFGAILSCLTQANARLSYLTDGQEVPDDIEVGHSRRVAELIVSGKRV